MALSDLVFLAKFGYVIITSDGDGMYQHWWPCMTLNLD